MVRRQRARGLVEAAVDVLVSLGGTQREQVPFHQDLHADNVLRSPHELWLVIDPKPLVGEREFSLAPGIRSSELGHGEQQVIHRLDGFTAELGLDVSGRVSGPSTIRWHGGTNSMGYYPTTSGWSAGCWQRV
jgi:streptomycin 6-kinase